MSKYYAPETILRSLYEARVAAKEAKTALAAYYVKSKGCTRCRTPSDFYESPCYKEYIHLPQAKWCKVCKASIPLYEDYRDKAKQRMRWARLATYEGKRLSLRTEGMSA